MPSGRFREVEALYRAVRDAPEAERRALLDQADPELRQQIEQLLAEDSAGSIADSTQTLVMVGVQLGPYTIEAPLGKGGMGEVFRALDSRLGRRVAIKLLDHRYSSRFEREARAISSLNHPNICTLYDVGPNYLVMELLEGDTLAARLKKGPLPLDQALLYARQIAAALAEAHEHGVIHRDLKPGNIVLTKSGAKVLDFGLATWEGADTLTVSRAVMGTPAYMAPEQREGKPADARSDIYSLGCTIYEMAAGVRPGPQRARLPSRALERVVNPCLEQDPSRRPQSAAELVEQLTAIASPPKRWKIIAPTAAAVLACATAGYFYLHRGPKLTDKDTIILGDFDNKTGDAVFDDTLRQGLAVQLHQSPYLSLVSDAKIRQTLQLMNKPPDQRLTAEVTREICERTGGAAMLTGSIESLGTRYVLGLRAISCSTGDTIDEQQAQSGKKEDVLDSLSDMASKFRARAGESLAAIQQNNVPLREATTSSLEALKAYTDALKGFTFDERGRPLLQRATEIDPQFALAWADLALSYSDLGEQELARESTANAYKWRDHTSGPEKFHIAYVYDRNVTGNLEKAWQTASLWRQTYPRDGLAFGLSAGYAAHGTGRYEEAIKFAEVARKLDPESPTSILSIIGANLYLDRFDDALKAVQRYIGLDNNSGMLSLRYFLAYLQGDRAGMDKAVSESTQRSEAAEYLDYCQALVAAQAGRLKDADRLSRRAVDLAEAAGAKERAATWIVAQALWNGFYENEAEARQRAETALRMATGRDLKYAAAFALASAHEFSRSEALAAELDKAYPEDTEVQSNYLPALRGLAAIDRKDPQKAIELLQANGAYEFAVPPLDFNTYLGGLYPVYVRGLAYLGMNRGAEAAAEFQKILDHKGLTVGDPVSAMARLQLARAWELAGDRAKAKAAYQQFLNLWKDADPDVPVLNQASAELAKL
jgi:eukaryotic-like serine/threonine-protein kinase